MGWWTTERKAYAVNYLISNGGLSPWGAAALVSRWANVESTGSGPASVNPSSGAFGIAQWLGARKAGIAGNTDFTSQLAYAVAELNGSEGHAGSLLRGATDANSGAIGASAYERAEGYNPATGRDNYTARTAAGASNVLSAWQAGQQSASTQVVASAETPANDQSSAGLEGGSGNGGETGAVAAGPTSMAALAIVAVLGILYFYLRD